MAPAGALPLVAFLLRRNVRAVPRARWTRCLAARCITDGGHRGTEKLLIEIRASAHDDGDGVVEVEVVSESSCADVP